MGFNGGLWIDLLLRGLAFCVVCGFFLILFGLWLLTVFVFYLAALGVCEGYDDFWVECYFEISSRDSGLFACAWFVTEVVVLCFDGLSQCRFSVTWGFGFAI